MVQQSWLRTREFSLHVRLAAFGRTPQLGFRLGYFEKRLVNDEPFFPTWQTTWFKHLDMFDTFPPKMRHLVHCFLRVFIRLRKRMWPVTTVAGWIVVGVVWRFGATCTLDCRCLTCFHSVWSWNIPWELTYPLEKRHVWVDEFPFPQVGYVSSLEGVYIYIYLNRLAPVSRRPGKIVVVDHLTTSGSTGNLSY